MKLIHFATIKVPLFLIGSFKGLALDNSVKIRQTKN